MRKKDMQEEITQLRDAVMEQGHAVVGLVHECIALKEERDKVVKDIRLLGRMGQDICCVCAHYNNGAGDPRFCPNALKEDCFEWRGVKHG